MKKAAENKLASNAKLRSVNTKFWDDQYIIQLEPIEKLLFLYFLTNTLTNLAGVYEISPERIAFDTGIDKDMVVKLIDRFEADNKILYREGYIFILNYQKNQNYNPKMVTNVENTLKSFPDSIRSIYRKLTKDEDYSLCIPYRESEGESEEEGEIESEGEKEVSHLTAHDSHSLEIEPPLLTELTDYIPNNCNNELELREAIIKVILSFTEINPDKSTVNQYLNLMIVEFRKSGQKVKLETSFKFFFECFSGFQKLDAKKKNLAYLYSMVRGKINDALIIGREKLAQEKKKEEKKEFTVYNPSVEVRDLADNMSIN